jgi:hypothetical protein
VTNTQQAKNWADNDLSQRELTDQRLTQTNTTGNGCCGARDGILLN